MRFDKGQPIGQGAAPLDEWGVLKMRGVIQEIAERQLAWQEGLYVRLGQSPHKSHTHTPTNETKPKPNPNPKPNPRSKPKPKRNEKPGVVHHSTNAGPARRTPHRRLTESGRSIDRSIESTVGDEAVVRRRAR